MSFHMTFSESVFFTLVSICYNCRISLFVKDMCFRTCKGCNVVRNFISNHSLYTHCFTWPLMQSNLFSEILHINWFYFMIINEMGTFTFDGQVLLSGSEDKWFSRSLYTSASIFEGKLTMFLDITFLDTAMYNIADDQSIALNIQNTGNFGGRGCEDLRYPSKLGVVLAITLTW